MRETGGTHLVALVSCFAAILCHCLCLRIGIIVLPVLSIVVNMGNGNSFVRRRTDWWEEDIICWFWLAERNAVYRGQVRGSTGSLALLDSLIRFN
jgi:hypothetical protein